MANKVYPYLRALALRGQLPASLAAATNVKAALVDTTAGGYTYSDSHKLLSDLGSNIVGTPMTLTSLTVSDLGVFDAADTVFTNVPAQTGNKSAAEALVIYYDTGTAGTSYLIGYFDTVSGLPVSPNGGNVIVTWDATGILTI